MCPCQTVHADINDVKWEQILNEQNLITWLISRYMDDGRTFMPPLNLGGDELLRVYGSNWNGRNWTKNYQPWK